MIEEDQNIDDDIFSILYIILSEDLHLQFTVNIVLNINI